MGEPHGSGGIERDWDEAVTQAWRDFRAGLADALAELGEDDIAGVEIADAGEDTAVEAGCTPYVQFCGWGRTLVRAEVSSNEFLADAYRLSSVAESALEAIGWAAPADDEGGSPNFSVDLERVEVDRLAVMVCRAFREVFEVVDPAFLVVHGLDLPRVTWASVPAPVPVPVFTREPVAVAIRDRDHLVELVDAVLAGEVEGPLVHDEDGDIPLVTESTVLYVRVRTSAPLVKVFGTVASGLDQEAAQREATRLGHEYDLFSFLAVDGSVLLSLHVPGDPFVAEQLSDLLGVAVRVADRIGRERQEGTELEDEAECQAAVEDDHADRPAVRQALLTLRHLELAEPGSVDPELAAGICDDDVDVLLGVLAALERAGDEDDLPLLLLTRHALRWLTAGRVARRRELHDHIARARRRNQERRAARDRELPGLEPDDAPGLFESR